MKKLFAKIKFKIKREGVLSTLKALIFYPFRYNLRKKYNEMLQKDSLEERFTIINQQNLWNSKESISGEGSELEYTSNLRFWLTKKVKELKVKKFVDAPCGDFNWMQYVCKEVDLNYVGLDIVEEIINKNNNVFSNDNTKFKVANICKDKVPDCEFLMVRDCLFHLSFTDIDNLLKNISSTNYKYLLTTTHIVDNNFTNSDIISGDFRLIDLFSAPFKFSKIFVYDRVKDHPPGYPIPKEMILIEKRHVPVSLEHQVTEF
jgi:hypothetical protein